MTSIHQAETPLTAAAPAQRAQSRQVSLSSRRLISRAVTYTLLFIGAAIMLFPMLWMFSASLKPEWQILVQPPIWIPSQWIHVQAGDTAQELPIYRVTDNSGQARQVIPIGRRRYTTVVEITRLDEVIAVPADDLGATQARERDGVMFNVRQWQNANGETRDVVALARDGDNLIVAPVEALAAISSKMPLATVNSGGRETVEMGDVEFRARELEDGRIFLPLGPETELTVVAPSEIAESAQLIPAEWVVEDDFTPVGNTEVQQYALAAPTDGASDEASGDPSDEQRYLLLTSEAWQPVLDFDTLMASGFVVPNGDLSGDEQRATFNGADLPVRTVERDGQAQEVAVLLSNSRQSLVIPRTDTETLRLVPISKLALPFVQTMDGFAVRYKEDFQLSSDANDEGNGDRQRVAIVGTRANMALVVPLETIESAFDVESSALSAVLVPHLHWENYLDALSRDLGGATFGTFFLNSAIVVVLNLLGHFLTVTVVAYGFARLRAPGKDFLFLILLATMMLPFPVMLIPTFEIFQRFGMINTLWPLFIRSFFGNAFLIFLLRQFYTTIPMEMEEAARIDGANTAQVLWHIMLPLSKPALATIGIFTFWWAWNSFFEPFVYISSVKNFTVSLGLAFFVGQYTTSYHLLMSASMVAILPIILIFFFAQRYFIEGIQLSGLKG